VPGNDKKADFTFFRIIMDNKTIYLQSWTYYNRIYAFDIETGNYRSTKKNAKLETCGVFKKFLFCKYLALYKIDDEWWVQYKKNRLMFADKENVSFFVRKNDLIVIFDATFNNNKFTFYDTALFVNIIQLIDPTFDYLDLITNSFVAWLYDLRKNEKPG
jgi:hypothetical protein